jgi:hypothetical protein
MKPLETQPNGRVSNFLQDTLFLGRYEAAFVDSNLNTKQYLFFFSLTYPWLGFFIALFL